jgi:5'(3')-deoxyribonucleotidase
MAKTVIAVDVDEVLAHHNVELVKYHNETYGSDLTLEHYVTDHWSEIWNTDRKETERRAVAYHDSGAFERLQPIKGAYEALKSLSEDFDLHIVTARRKSIVDTTHEWVEMHYPGIFKSVRFVHLWDDANPPTKAEICQELGASLLIDDSITHCELAARGGLDSVLFGDYPWNRALPASFPKDILRAHNWDDVVGYIREKYEVRL